MKRPDHKQEFVVQWQQNYNALSAHLRGEDVMKAELHCRVDVSAEAPTASTSVTAVEPGSGPVAG